MVKKKKIQDSGLSDIERFQLRATYYLDLIEKRILEYQKKLEKINNIIKKAAKQGDRFTLVKALRFKKNIERDLNTYWGMYEKLRLILEKVQRGHELVAISGIFEDANTILNRVSAKLNPERIELVTASIEESVDRMEEAESLLAEDLHLSEDLESIEEEADKLIASYSLPSTKEKKEAEKVDEKSDLLSELKKAIEE